MTVRTTLTGGLLRVAERLNPVMNSPGAPLKTRAFFHSFGPSLMPRATVHQGMAAGMSVLAAELVVAAVDGAVRRFVPNTAPFALRFGARAAVAAAGVALSRLPETKDEATPRAAARSAGELATAGAVGGMIYHTAGELRSQFPPKSSTRLVVSGIGGFAAGLVYARELLSRRQSVIQRWTEDDKPATVAGSVAVGATVAVVGRGIGRGFLASRRSMIRFFGDDLAHAPIGRLVNGATWAAGGAALYSTVVSRIARSNEVIEPAYATPPDTPYVSGGTNSISPFEELGLQGRRYVTDVVTPDIIEDALGEKAVAHPIRAYVGVNSEPLYPSGRSEMMLDELERLGAFERSYLLLISPTGTGWVDQAMIEAAEIFTRGDIATACIQYGRGPSFLEVQKVHLGRSQFRGLLWGVKMRLASMPEEERPAVLVFGESLGAWSSSDVVMHQGIDGFDHYGIDRALWFGLPGLAKWSKTGMREGSGDLVPPGTVGAFDNFGQYEELSEEERASLRAVVVDHDNDPIAQLSARLAVKRPPWLSGDGRGRNVAGSMDWIPVVTLVQTLVDAMNAMRTVPGQFKSFGHDYRADTPAFVHSAYHLDGVTEDQMQSVFDTLRRMEIERGERIKQSKAAAQGESPQRTTRRILRRGDPAKGTKDVVVDVTPGDAPADVQ